MKHMIDLFDPSLPLSCPGPVSQFKLAQPPYNLDLAQGSPSQYCWIYLYHYDTE